MEALLGRQLTGLITTPISADQSYLRPWQDRTTIVFIDRSPSKITADSVVEDDPGGAYQATEHLIGHGHQRIAFIGDSVTTATTARRLVGYRAALADAGIAEDPRLILLGAHHGTRGRRGGHRSAESRRAADRALLLQRQVHHRDHPRPAGGRPQRHPVDQLRRLPARRGDPAAALRHRPGPRLRRPGGRHPALRTDRPPPPPPQAHDRAPGPADRPRILLRDRPRRSDETPPRRPDQRSSGNRQVDPGRRPGPTARCGRAGPRRGHRPADRPGLRSDRRGRPQRPQDRRAHARSLATTPCSRWPRTTCGPACRSSSWRRSPPSVR